MIKRIGVIYQDANSLGFLVGLRDRLKCEAEIIGPPTSIGRTQYLTRKHGRSAWRYFEAKGVDLVVLFTDADGQPWQGVRKTAGSRFPDSAAGRWVCGVAVNNPEEWLALDRTYLREAIGLSGDEPHDREPNVGRIKDAIKRARRDDENTSDITARIVRDAPPEAFKQWLRDDDALRSFYAACRQAATAADCDTPNELDDA